MAKKQVAVDEMFDGFTSSSEALGRARKMFRSLPPPLSEGVTEAQPLPIEQLLDNPYQPRTEIRIDELEGLVASIKQYGFRGTLLGRPSATNSGYTEIAYGHRRREAARLAGLDTLLVELASLTDQEMAALAAVENIQREDLNPVEEGRLYRLMIDEMNYTQVQVAEEIGKSRGYVENRLRAAVAPQDVQQMVAKRPNTLHYVPKLSRLEPGIRAQVVTAVLEGRITGEGVEDYVTMLNTTPEQGSSSATRRSSAGKRPKYSRTNLDVALRAVEGYRRHVEARDAVTTEELVKMRSIRDELNKLLGHYDIVG